MSLNNRPNRLRCASRHTQAPHALNVFAKPHHVSRGAGSFGSIGESFLRFDFLFVFLASGCHLCGNQLVHDAAVMAPSGDEPAPPRHRAGVASMAWRTTRRFNTNAL